MIIIIPPLKRSLSTRSRTVGGGTTAVDFTLSEPEFSTAKEANQRSNVSKI